jgi:hypothetical protein
VQGLVLNILNGGFFIFTLINQILILLWLNVETLEMGIIFFDSLHLQTHWLRDSFHLPKHERRGKMFIQVGKIDQILQPIQNYIQYYIHIDYTFWYRLLEIFQVWEIVALLLCKIDLIRIVCVFTWEIKAFPSKDVQN